jgi:hypothetical protein
MKDEVGLEELYLSPVYRGRSLGWVMVYHTRDTFDGEVEIMKAEKDFFASEKEAWEWFHAAHKAHEYLQPEAVELYDMGALSVRRPKPSKA